MLSCSPSLNYLKLQAVEGNKKFNSNSFVFLLNMVVGIDLIGRYLRWTVLGGMVPYYNKVFAL